MGCFYRSVIWDGPGVHFADILGTFWEVLGIIGESFWEILVGFRSHGNNLGSLCADWFHAIFLFVYTRFPFPC